MCWVIYGCQESRKHRSFAPVRVAETLSSTEGLLKAYCAHSTGLRREREKKEPSLLSSERKGLFRSRIYNPPCTQEQAVGV